MNPSEPHNGAKASGEWLSYGGLAVVINFSPRTWNKLSDRIPTYFGPYLTIVLPYNNSLQTVAVILIITNF